MLQDTILSHLSPDYPWKDRMQYFPTIGSTNDVLKDLAKQDAPHGTAIVAGHQSGGRGRRGRSFHSPEDMGIYLSILLRPNCPPEQLMHLTCAVGEAMCDATEQACGLRPGIKWTNDLVFGKHKLGGILTELGMSPQGTVAYTVIGIGINCCQRVQDFPPEIRDMAASLQMVTGQQIDRDALAAAMLEALYRMDGILLTNPAGILSRYRRDCITIGQEICVVRGDEVRRGKALDVDDLGALVVSYADGTVEAVNSGEVSIRGMYGYV